MEMLIQSRPLLGAISPTCNGAAEDLLVKLLWRLTLKWRVGGVELQGFYSG